MRKTWREPALVVTLLVVVTLMGIFIVYPEVRVVYQMCYRVQIDGNAWIVDQADPGVSARIFDGPVVVSVDPGRVHVVEGSNL
jgi:hypothetical protein